MEGIRRAPVDMEDIPFFIEFKKNNRWLARFLPSTVCLDQVTASGKKTHSFQSCGLSESRDMTPQTTKKVAFCKENPLISGKSRLVKYYQIEFWMTLLSRFSDTVAASELPTVNTA